jgi:hypothetical protein
LADPANSEDPDFRTEALYQGMGEFVIAVDSAGFESSSLLHRRPRRLQRLRVFWRLEPNLAPHQTSLVGLQDPPETVIDPYMGSQTILVGLASGTSNLGGEPPARVTLQLVSGNRKFVSFDLPDDLRRKHRFTLAPTALRWL